MLKVKKTPYGPITRNNELTKFATEIKQAIQKQEKKKTKKTRKLMIFRN